MITLRDYLIAFLVTFSVPAFIYAVSRIGEIHEKLREVISVLYEIRLATCPSGSPIEFEDEDGDKIVLYQDPNLDTRGRRYLIDGLSVSQETFDRVFNEVTGEDRVPALWELEGDLSPGPVQIEAESVSFSASILPGYLPEGVRGFIDHKPEEVHEVFFNPTRRYWRYSIALKAVDVPASLFGFKTRKEAYDAIREAFSSKELAACYGGQS